MSKLRDADPVEVIVWAIAFLVVALCLAAGVNALRWGLS